ncbi:MAG: hypothetical protein ACYS0E_02415 [Planctomycetota bacterium]|jgi:hypothetical protein
MTERENTLRTALIIHVAITMGPAIFLGVVGFLVHAEESELGAGETGSIISFVSLAAALGAMAVSVVVPRVMSARPGNRFDSFRAAAVVRAAALEMPALLGCVAYMLEGKNTPLGAGVALGMILLLAGTVPTGSRLDAWLSESPARPDGR